MYDTIGVWITETPITPESVLRALAAKAAGTDAPREDGKLVAFDDALSVNTVATGIAWAP